MHANLLSLLLLRTAAVASVALARRLVLPCLILLPPCTHPAAVFSAPCACFRSPAGRLIAMFVAPFLVNGAARLKAAGATEVIPEAMESSLLNAAETLVAAVNKMAIQKGVILENSFHKLPRPL